MADRFDFEQQIMKCWSMVDDVEQLYNQVMESDHLNKDEIANYLLGLKTIYNVKFDTLFNQFEQLIKEKQL